eukprot:TRINITY_DN10181_c1_g1_i1.p1 TRINITY_DN10181_c1_g1~~TRINITY_DN10181_c1_g1_i1.p1  ORF type:complete len:103 (-),score=20.31 TRINITY_DN10181_c1_g1_i1:109-390(-)
MASMESRESGRFVRDFLQRLRENDREDDREDTPAQDFFEYRRALVGLRPVIFQAFGADAIEADTEAPSSGEQLITADSFEVEAETRDDSMTSG